MRIKSRFRDYYDGVQQFGQDDLVYPREPKTFEKSGGYCESSEAYIGFAGKIYPVLYPYLTNHGSSEVPCLSIEDLDKYIDTHGSKKDCLIYYNEGGRYKNYNGYHRNYRESWFKNEPKSDGFLSSYQDNRAKWHKEFLPTIFEKFNVPIFVVHKPILMGAYDRYKLDINACLRKYQLARVLPPYQAYQELYMWLCNRANPIKEPPPIDDKTMCEIKGFDKKTSFRKGKSE